MTGHHPAEIQRLSSLSSVAEFVAREVTALTPIPRDELRDWLMSLSLPAGWQLGHIPANTAQPSRVAVYGSRSDGGWDACETLTVFRFTGPAPVATLHEQNDCTLRDLGADYVASFPLIVERPNTVAAVRSTGYFSANGRRAWAQDSTYIRAGTSLLDGVLICHTLFVESEQRSRLRDDLADLCDAVQEAFVADLGTVDGETPVSPESEVARNGT